MTNIETAAAGGAVTRVVDRSLVRPGWIVLAVGWLIMLIPFPGTGIIGMLVAGGGGLVLAVVNLARGAVGTGILQLLGATLGTAIVYFIGLAIFAAGVIGAS